MKVILIILFLFTFLFCLQSNSVYRINSNIVSEIKSNFAYKNFNRLEFRDDDYEQLDSLIDKNFGVIRLIRSINNDNEKTEDSIFLFYTLDSNFIKIPLTDIGFFNVSGQIYSNLFLNKKLAIILVELDIDYHSGLGSEMTYLEAWKQKQKILVDLYQKKVIFDCTPINENFSSVSKDTMINNQIKSIWINDSSKYEYKFHLNDYFIILDSLTGNASPDIEIGKYILHNNKYVKQN